MFIIWEMHFNDAKRLVNQEYVQDMYSITYKKMTIYYCLQEPEKHIVNNEFLHFMYRSALLKKLSIFHVKLYGIKTNGSNINILGLQIFFSTIWYSLLKIC